MSAGTATDLGAIPTDDKSEIAQNIAPSFFSNPLKRNRQKSKPYSDNAITDMDDSRIPVTPEASASIISLLTFWWLNKLMILGAKRPLQPTDLYRMKPAHESAVLADKLEQDWAKQCEKAALGNQMVQSGQIIGPSWFRRMLWRRHSHKRKEQLEADWANQRKQPNLWRVCTSPIKWYFASAGMFKVVADTLQTLQPLLIKYLLAWSTNSYYAHRAGTPLPHIGIGVGYAIGIYLFQLCAAVCTAQFFYRSQSSGVLTRAGLIVSLFRRATNLSSRSRAKIPISKLINHMSTDIARIDFSCSFYWTKFSAPFQVTLCLVLLIINLGWSALVGIAFFMIVFPLQTLIMKYLYSVRKKAMVHTDSRIGQLQEVFNGIRIIKYFAWEDPYLERIDNARRNELKYTNRILNLRSLGIALAFSLPALSSVLAFVAYKLSGHNLNAAIIFSSLTLFNLLRAPLMQVPQALNSSVDAKNSCVRLRDVYTAELLSSTRTVVPDAKYAIQATNANFTWEALNVVDVKEAALEKQQVSGLHDINLAVHTGQLVVICGAVGSGKSSLLQGLLGEMRKTSGEVVFSGSIAYCAQTAWCLNMTVRGNICFGKPFEEDRYWKCVRAASLLQDFEILPAGDASDIGEKGINLSGGQKQRISLARALYSDADIYLLDDCLSALDAHVGAAVFKEAICGILKDKTVLLVTHALHHLPDTDYVYLMDDGRIVEHGTYHDLTSGESGNFKSLIDRYGLAKEDATDANEADKAGNKAAMETVETKVLIVNQKNATAGALMTKEEREIGAQRAKIYGGYVKHAKPFISVPLLLISIIVSQTALVMTSYWLVWWQEDKFTGLSQGTYMAIYASIGVAGTITNYLMGAAFAQMGKMASASIHNAVVESLIRAPVAFFDSTPLGRIMSRLTRDIETLDNQLVDSARMFVTMGGATVGGIIVIIIVQHWFALALAIVLLGYYALYRFYNKSAQEIKRIDSILRSEMYSHFSEALTGLSTIRAYDQVERFREENARKTDHQNRAYMLTTSNQRWVATRLDFFSSILTLVVAIIAVAGRTSISPAQIGIALAYIVTVGQGFSFAIRQSVMVQQNMNSAERLLFWTHELPSEESTTTAKTTIPESWPTHGEIKFNNVQMRYRSDLPLVVKNVSFTVKPGEFLGIIGRTGSGKSSLMVSLYRFVELCGGSIEIDGVDASKISLHDLRSHLSMIPQDPTLFSGTLRSQLDPFGLHNDVTLNEALRRACLIGDEEDLKSARLSLDFVCESNGENLSVGQRSLVALARALVRDSKILCLDEATSSTDLETDAKVQQTILSQFKDKTLLCIAHRIRTIMGYDRVLTLSDGEIKELDTPINLYRNANGVFRGLCEESGITEEDILKARQERQSYEQ